MDWACESKDWPHREASRFVRAGGLNWHVQEFGAPDAPVCLLLHGTAGATHSWEGLAPLLAERFRVVAMDLPGHGFTTRPPLHTLSLTGMAQAINALIKQLGVKPTLAIGHSAGAAVAIQMTLAGGMRPGAIIAINGALMPFKGMAGQVFPSLAKLLVVNPFVPRLFAFGASRDRVRSLLDSTGSKLTPQQFEFYRRLFNDHGHVGAALGMMASWDLDGLQRRWSRLGVPLHLIVGSADKTIPPSDAPEIAALLPGTQIHILDGLGHLAHEESADCVAETIAKIA